MLEKTVLIFVPVFNEIRFIETTIESILDQSYKNIILLVSDNHSIDGSDKIIEKYSQIDKRLIFIKPEIHLNSFEHTKFIVNYIKNNYSEIEFVSQAGGHDILQKNYIELLYQNINQSPQTILVYPKGIEIDGDDKIIKEWDNFLEVADVDPILKPLVVLMTLNHNVCIFGIWRKDFWFKSFEFFKESFVGMDHHIIAYASTLGNLKYNKDAVIFLRNLQNSGDMKVYKEKHLSKKINSSNDFVLQLDNVVRIINDRKKSNNGFMNQEAAEKIITVATLLAYMMRYYHNLLIEDGGVKKFFNNPFIRELLEICFVLDKKFENLHRVINEKEL